MCVREEKENLGGGCLSSGESEIIIRLLEMCEKNQYLCLSSPLMVVTSDFVFFLQRVLTDASTYLHHATRERAYFEDVTIVVPPTWTYKPEYEVVQGGDRFTRAEVRVDFANTAHGDQPYTLQPGECGEPGEYIHITPEFLMGVIAAETLTSTESKDNDTLQADAPATNDNNQYVGPKWPYGNPAKVFVHEWAHLRYGTFDEHGYQGDEQMPAFYQDSSNMVRVGSRRGNATLTLTVIH